MAKAKNFILYLCAAAVCVLLVGAGSLLAGGDTAAEAVPEPGEWFYMTPDGTMAADGSPVTTCIRVGTLPNTMVLFCGGGISINEYTAARSYGVTEIPDGFYSDNGSVILENIIDSGLLNFEQSDLLANWNIIIIPYSTADYHIGTGDFPYTTLDGEDAVLHHCGYTNFRAIMDAASQYITGADNLLIAGYSAGGFGAVMLADELIEDYFPDAQNITLCIDSALNVSDSWQSIAADVWQTPEHITDTIQSDNLVVDFMSALYEKYGESLRYLYVNSLYDGELTRYQNYFFTDDFESSNEQSLNFEYMLNDMLTRLRQAVPTIGIYLYDHLPYTFSADQSQLTQHTILTSDTIFWPLTDNTSVMQWITNAVNGRVQSRGLDLLDNLEEPETP